MTFKDSPWWRAPAALIRRPGVAVSLAAAAFVAVLPAAAAPQFLAASQSATMQSQIADGCPASAGVEVSEDFLAPRPDFVRSDMAAIASVAGQAPNVSRSGVASLVIRQVVPGLPADNPPRTPWVIALMSRTGFEGNVRVLESAPSPVAHGVWVPDDIAKVWQVHPGQSITLTGPDPDRPATVTVAGVYRNLTVGRLSNYWCPMRPYLQSVNADGDGPPPVLLTDPDTVITVEQRQDPASSPVLIGQYDAPLIDSSPSPESTQRTAAAIDQIPSLVGASRLPQDAAARPPEVHSDLGRFGIRAELVRGSLAAPVYAVSVAGVLVGLLVLAAATVLWAVRRQHELMVLAVRGSPPYALGFKAVLECAAAILIGGACGLAAAHWIVATAGPSDQTSSVAFANGARAAVLVALAGLAVVFVTGLLRCRSLTDARPPRAHRRSRLAAVPWEALVIVAAVPLWRSLGGGIYASTADAATSGQVIRLAPRTLVVPILVIIAASVLCSRVAVALLRPWAARVRPRSHGRYLAWRRLAREPLALATLIAVAAVPAAVAGFGAIATASVQRTVDSKAVSTVGSDIVVSLDLGAGMRAAPPSVARLSATAPVLRTESATAGGYQVSLLGVKDSFGRAAPVGNVLAGDGFNRLLRRVATSTAAHPVVLASQPVPAGAQQLTFGSTSAAVTVVSVPALPGQLTNIPLVIANPATLPPAMFSAATPQIWVSTTHAEQVVAAVAADRTLPVTRVVVAADIYRDTLFEPITYTFEYFVAIAMLTGVVVAVGLLLYLESRTVSHRRAYVMLRRMGLKPRTHRAALLWELGAALGLGLAIAAAIVTVLGNLVRGGFDVFPDRPPATILTAPVVAIVVIVACVVATATASALFAHRRVARAHPATVLRDAA